MEQGQEVNIGFVKLIRSRLKTAIAGGPKRTTRYKPTSSAGIFGALWKSLSKSYFNALKEAQARIEKYAKYAFLDKNLSEATAAVNIYADNMVSGAIGGEENYKVMIDENTPNGEVIEEIVEKLEKRTKIKDQVWEFARDMTCAGDRFDEIVVEEQQDGNIGISKLKKLPEKEMYADVDDRGVFKDENFPYYQRPGVYARKKLPFDWWRIVHFKVGSGIYGVDRSLFANASLRIGRQLLWIDDAIVLARLSRACQRYAYMVDTTGVPPAEKFEYVKQWLSDMRSKEVINALTGEIEMDEVPPLPDEDIAIPVEKDSPQGIEVLGGDTNLGKIEDVKYLQNKFFMAVGMPKAYASIEEGVRGKATLTQLDIQFARQVRRRQQALRPGLTQIYATEFILNDIDPNSFSWSITFPILGTMDEMLKWQMEKVKAEVAKLLSVDMGVVNDLYVLEVLLGMSKEDIEKYARVLPVEPGDEKKAFDRFGQLQLSSAMIARINRDPELRAMLSDMTDIINWKISQEQEIEGKKALGLGRETPVKDNWE